jgi:hypothetical protein
MLLDAIRLPQRKDFDPTALVTYVSHGFTLGRGAAKRHALTHGSPDVIGLAPAPRSVAKPRGVRDEAVRARRKPRIPTSATASLSEPAALAPAVRAFDLGSGTPHKEAGRRG